MFTLYQQHIDKVIYPWFYYNHVYDESNKTWPLHALPVPRRIWICGISEEKSQSQAKTKADNA